VALAAAAHPSSPSPLVSVSELTPITTFGGDIVRIKAGPGGDFGNGLYAISRGAGDNSAIGAINRPGVIYRVDPATGKASVFFDLNTVLSQLEPGGNASNGLGVSTGLQNWYDITFDREGYFDGRPSMFVSSVSSTDPFKNGIFRIAPDGSFLGFFTQETQGASARITRAPSAILVPPTEQQSFLRGLIAGSGLSDPNTGFDALFFNANAFTPGQNVTPTSLPAGVAPLPGFNLGPQVGFTAANSDYVSPDYSGYTNFGTPAGGGIPAAPGQSGLQGIGGDLPIGSGAPGVFPPLNTTNIDLYPSITSDFRRIQDVGFDQYGYFSYGFPTTLRRQSVRVRPRHGTLGRGDSDRRGRDPSARPRPGPGDCDDRERGRWKYDHAEPGEPGRPHRPYRAQRPGDPLRRRFPHLRRDRFDQLRRLRALHHVLGRRHDHVRQRR
jgi:hypothetical protein